MDDLISRKAAILQLSHNKCGNDENDIAVQHDIETIITLPSAQPERMRGRWIPNIYPDVGDGYRCSQCGAYHVVQYKFCHNCGADMRGGQNG